MAASPIAKPSSWVWAVWAFFLFWSGLSANAAASGTPLPHADRGAVVASAQAAALPPDSNGWTLVTTLTDDFALWAVDPFQHLIVYTQGQQLRKYRPDGTLLFQNDLPNYGTLTSIDASNPLRIVLFYRDFQIVQILDRTLSEHYVYRLGDYGILQAEAVCADPDNGLWLYDSWSAQLKKIAPDGTLVRESVQLLQWLDTAPEPLQLVRHTDRLYLLDASLGLLAFNQLGGFVAAYPEVGGIRRKAYGSYAYRIAAGRTLQLDWRTRRERPFVAPVAAASAREFVAWEGGCMVASTGGIAIFRKE